MEHPIDKYFREKLENRHFEFKEEYWQKAQARIRQRRKHKLRRWLLLCLGLVCSFSLFLYFNPVPPALPTSPFVPEKHAGQNPALAPRLLPATGESNPNAHYLPAPPGTIPTESGQMPAPQYAEWNRGPAANPTTGPTQGTELVFSENITQPAQQNGGIFSKNKPQPGEAAHMTQGVFSENINQPAQQNGGIFSKNKPQPGEAAHMTQGVFSENINQPAQQNGGIFSKNKPQPGEAAHMAQGVFSENITQPAQQNGGIFSKNNPQPGEAAHMTQGVFSENINQPAQQNGGIFSKNKPQPGEAAHMTQNVFSENITQPAQQNGGIFSKNKPQPGETAHMTQGVFSENMPTAASEVRRDAAPRLLSAPLAAVVYDEAAAPSLAAPEMPRQRPGSWHLLAGAHWWSGRQAGGLVMLRQRRSLRGRWHWLAGGGYEWRDGRFDASKSAAYRQYRFGVEVDSQALRPSSLHYGIAEAGIGWQRGRHILEITGQAHVLVGVRGARGRLSLAEGSHPPRYDFSPLERGWIDEAGFRRLRLSATATWWLRPDPQSAIGLRLAYNPGGLNAPRQGRSIVSPGGPWTLTLLGSYRF